MLQLLTHHAYEGMIEIIVDVGDYVVTHYLFVVALKAGVLGVGLKTVKHVRNRVKK